MNYLKLAFRNLSRNRKRTIVTVLTITLGFTALGTIGGMLSNIFSRLKEQAIVNERLGHFSIAKEGAGSNGKLFPEKYLWDQVELNKILEIIRSDQDVVLATPRIALNGIISNGKTSTIFISEGVVPSDDNILFQTDIDGRIQHDNVAGLPENSEEVISISEELATSLKVKKGDVLTLLTSTKDGIANAIDVTVGNIFNTGNPATNDKFLLSNLALLQRLYDTNGAMKVVITVSHIDDLEKIQNRVIGKLNSKDFKVESQTWNKMSSSYEKVKAMFGVIFRVLTVIISVIVLLTALNTMQMNVNERTKEIGTIRAIGMTSANVVKLFCFEGLVMTLLGCGLGIVMLLLVKTALSLLNVTFIPPVASISVPISIVLTLSQLIITFTVFLLVGVLSAFLASRRIARQSVIDSLRYNN